MTRILSSDLLIADVITPFAGNAALQALVQKYGMQPGGKIPLDKPQFEEFSAALIGFPVTIVPGGSSANMLVTLRKLLGEVVSVDFIGVAGEGLSSLMIRSSLEEAGIRLHPAHLGNRLPKTAMSYVVVLPDGQRTIATYPGNAGELLTPEMIPEELVRACDVVHVLGSLWAKINPEFADTLVDRCMAHNKQFWLSLPTHGVGRMARPDIPALIAGADLLLGNEEELERCLGDGALERLRGIYRNTPRRAFITRSGEGAVVVSSRGVEPVAPVPVAAAQVVNTLGAGDAAFAGFVAGFLKGVPDAISGKIGVALASEKLKINAARLPDPRSALPKILMDYLRAGPID